MLQISIFLSFILISRRHCFSWLLWILDSNAPRKADVLPPITIGQQTSRPSSQMFCIVTVFARGLLLSIWWKCPFALSKMPSYILWQNALFKNALFLKGIFNRSILSRNIEGHFWKSKRAFHICTLEISSYTTWQNAPVHNALFEKGILNKSIL